MSAKSNPNPSVLATLSEDQQQQLLAWLEEYPAAEVLLKVGAPPPDGFGLKTHITSLRRFYAQMRAAQEPENIDIAALLADKARHHSGSLDLGTAWAIKERAFQLAIAPQLDAEHFKTVARWVLRLENQKQRAAEINLEERRLALEQKKFEFNAAREALSHLADLETILNDNQKDDEDKIRAARDAVFGASPDAPK
jgi:hypothetical protein